MINLNFISPVSIFENWLLKFLTSPIGLADLSSQLKMTMINAMKNPIEFCKQIYSNSERSFHIYTNHFNFFLLFQDLVKTIEG